MTKANLYRVTAEFTPDWNVVPPQSEVFNENCSAQMSYTNELKKAVRKKLTQKGLIDQVVFFGKIRKSELCCAFRVYATKEAAHAIRNAVRTFRAEKYKYANASQVGNFGVKRENAPKPKTPKYPLSVSI